jgi:hypothetical protein
MHIVGLHYIILSQCTVQQHKLCQNCADIGCQPFTALVSLGQVLQPTKFTVVHR